MYPNSSPLTDIPLYPTPQHEACNHGYVEMTSLLLDHGALVNIPGFENDTPLHDAVVNGHMQVASLLVARGANINIRYDWDYSSISVVSGSFSLSMGILIFPKHGGIYSLEANS